MAAAEPPASRDSAASRIASMLRSAVGRRGAVVEGVSGRSLFQWMLTVVPGKGRRDGRTVAARPTSAAPVTAAATKAVLSPFVTDPAPTAIADRTATPSALPTSCAVEVSPDA